MSKKSYLNPSEIQSLVDAYQYSAYPNVSRLSETFGISQSTCRKYLKSNGYLFSQKITKKDLKKIVSESVSWLEVDAKLYKLLSNKLYFRLTYSHGRRLIKKLIEYGIDYSHFANQEWFKGRRDMQKLTPEQVLIKHEVRVRNKKASRESSSILKRALIESGVKYECPSCGISEEYNGRLISLEIHHVNTDILDNRKENLVFLCPNCHSQVHKTKSLSLS